MTSTPNGVDTRLIQPAYRADIDGLRAIAVLMVVGFHAFPLLAPGGFIGVDVFFVISGFLISTIIFESLDGNKFSFIEFYGRRVRRIFPALLVVLMTVYGIGWFVLLADEYKQLGQHIVGGAAFASNLVLWGESGYFDNAAQTKPLLHLWSLGIEEQFYIVWPLLLWVLWKQRLNLLTVTLVVTFISFGLNLGALPGDRVAAFYSPLTRWWELAIGAALAHLFLYRPNALAAFGKKLDVWLAPIVYVQTPPTNGQTLRNVQSVMGAALIIAGVLIITKERAFPGWWAVLPTAGTALIIAAGADAWFNRTILANRLLVWFGLISFPLYLWHWPLLSFAHVLESETPAAELRAAVVVVSVALAWLTYRLIEQPIRLGAHRPAKTMLLLVLMMLVGYVGYDCMVRNGWASRLPKIVQAASPPIIGPAVSWRMRSCMLLEDQDSTSFSGCESPKDKGRKTLFLWGDSNAAHLYPGYKANFEQTFNIVQRTAISCPPILDMRFEKHSQCQEINDYVFDQIKTERPEKIVLAALWTHYDWTKIRATIVRLQQLGIRQIDVVGPLPEWKDGLPRQIYLYSKAYRFESLPARMRFGLNQNVFKVDSAMRTFSQEMGVNYISPMKILCSELGCLTTTGDAINELIAFDFVHLTEGGSRLLVSHFPKE